MRDHQVDPRLIIPPPPPRYVNRPRLIAALDNTANVPLMVLAAGPGAGKTALLSDWAQQIQGPVAWMSLTAADAAPRRFWPMVWSALGHCAQAGAASAPVLIIDEAHLLTHQEVLDGLDALIRTTPPRVRLVLAARSDPLLPLHRYRLAGQMRELRARDLAMTRSEAAELLTAHGVTLREEDLDMLLARTEGWAAGIRLCAMRMEGAQRPEQFIAELALDEGSIGEYLITEVLDQHPEPIRRLLTETSLFTEVTAELAEAVTGMAGCADTLAHLARTNSFVIPLDTGRTRFRYHQLLAEVLRHNLRWRERSRIPELMRRAAAHFEDQGDLVKALYWVSRARHWPRTGSLLAHGAVAQAFVQRADLSSFGLAEYQSPAPGEADARETAVASDIIAAVLASPASAADELAKLDQPTETGPASGDLVTTAGLTKLMLGMKAGDAKTVTAAADDLLMRAAPEYQIPGLRAAVLLGHASSQFWHGWTDDAQSLLRAALTEAQRDGTPEIELETLAMTALVHSLHARPRSAGDATHQAHALLRTHDDMSIPAALELATAASMLMAADLAGAAQALQRAQVNDSVGSDSGLPAAREVIMAALLISSGQLEMARAALDRSAEYTSLPLLTLLREGLRADVETSLGRPHHSSSAVSAHRPWPL